MKDFSSDQHELMCASLGEDKHCWPHRIKRPSQSGLHPHQGQWSAHW